MKTTLNTYQIADALVRDEYAGWSRAGALALAKYLEEYEKDTGEEMELDVVALRCDFSEYASASEAAGEYDRGPADDDDDKEAAALEWLQDRTTVIEFDGGVIVQAF